MSVFKEHSGVLSCFCDGYRLFGIVVGIRINEVFGDVDSGQKRKMIGRITLFPAKLNNLRNLHPYGRGDKNIVEPEPENKSAEPVEGHHVSIIGMLEPKGVQQWSGI